MVVKELTSGMFDIVLCMPRFSQTVVPAGGADVYLTNRYSRPEEALGFAQWVEENFPPRDGVDYASRHALTEGSPCQVRPWQLGFRSDCGINGYSDPEESENLLDLVLNNGSCGSKYWVVQTNSN